MVSEDSIRNVPDGRERKQQRWIEPDLRIATGFIKPHFFAGFSGAILASERTPHDQWQV